LGADHPFSVFSVFWEIAWSRARLAGAFDLDLWRVFRRSPRVITLANYRAEFLLLATLIVH
jgi:hypothetical protein